MLSLSFWLTESLLIKYYYYASQLTWDSFVYVRLCYVIINGTVFPSPEYSSFNDKLYKYPNHKLFSQFLLKIIIKTQSFPHFVAAVSWHHRGICDYQK